MYNLPKNVYCTQVDEKEYLWVPTENGKFCIFNGSVRVIRKRRHTKGKYYRDVRSSEIFNLRK